MVVTYQVTGIVRKIIQVMFVGILFGEVYTLFLLFQSKDRDYFLFTMVVVISLIVKYLQGYLVYRIQIDVENKSIRLNRSWGKKLVFFREVKEWGYRNIVNETDSGRHQKNLEIYLKDGRKVIYPFHFSLIRPPTEMQQALIDCLGSSPKTYSMKLYTMQTDVLFVLL